MTAKEFIEQHFSCTCDEMYKRRKLTDPNCFLCDNEETMEDVMTLYANQRLVDFVDWYNTQYGASVSHNSIVQFNQ